MKKSIAYIILFLRYEILTIEIVVYTNLNAHCLSLRKISLAYPQKLNHSPSLQIKSLPIIKNKSFPIL